MDNLTKGGSVPLPTIRGSAKPGVAQQRGCQLRTYHSGNERPDRAVDRCPAKHAKQPDDLGGDFDLGYPADRDSATRFVYLCGLEASYKSSHRYPYDYIG